MENYLKAPEKGTYQYALHPLGFDFAEKMEASLPPNWRWRPYLFVDQLVGTNAASLDICLVIEAGHEDYEDTAFYVVHGEPESEEVIKQVLSEIRRIEKSNPF